MRTVYAVSSGDYSDYVVHCLFDREEDAERHATVRNTEYKYFGAYIQQIQIFGPGEQPERISHHVRAARIADGQLEEHLRVDILWNYDVVEDFDESPSSWWPVSVAGRDKSKVEKVYYDRLAQLKAEAEDIT